MLQQYSVIKQTRQSAILRETENDMAIPEFSLDRQNTCDGALVINGVPWYKGCWGHQSHKPMKQFPKPLLRHQFCSPTKESYPELKHVGYLCYLLIFYD